MSKVCDFWPVVLLYFTSLTSDLLQLSGHFKSSSLQTWYFFTNQLYQRCQRIPKLSINPSRAVPGTCRLLLTKLVVIMLGSVPVCSAEERHLSLLSYLTPLRQWPPRCSGHDKTIGTTGFNPTEQSLQISSRKNNADRKGKTIHTRNGQFFSARREPRRSVNYMGIQ